MLYKIKEKEVKHCHDTAIISINFLLNTKKFTAPESIFFKDSSKHKYHNYSTLKPMLTWIVTPLSNIYTPMQGAARLYAYIKHEGHNVSFKDFNQNAFFTLLKKEYLEDCFTRLNGMLYSVLRTQYLLRNYNSILKNSSSNFLNNLIKTGSIDYNANIQSKEKSSNTNSSLFFQVLENKDELIKKISKASNTLDKHLFNLPHDEFLNNYATILCGKAFYDAVYFPVLLDFGFGLFSAGYSLDSPEIYSAVHDEKHNFLINYFKSDVLPMVDLEQPKIIGISITHSSDIIPALTLGNLLKQNYPDIHICLGGATISEIAYRLKRNPLLWNFFDSLIMGPGEESFSCLIDHLTKNKNLDKVPNLIFKTKSGIKENHTMHEFDLNKACCPEFPSIRPRNPISLETATGCYWGKCIFCYYPKMGRVDNKAIQSNSRKLELVFSDIEKLKALYNPLYISLTDSAVHPERLSNILDFNKEKKLDLKFSAFIRFEKEFLSKSFCSKLANNGFIGGQIGLESGSQRVNDIINKGVTLGNAKKILKNFYEKGLLIHLYTIIGIPGEQKKDAVKTFDFIHKMHKFLTLDWQLYSFTLLEKSPINTNSSFYGITPHYLPDTFLTQYLPYEIANGLTQEESLKLCMDYNEILKKFLNPLSKVMDVESYKQVLFSLIANE